MGIEGYPPMPPRQEIRPSEGTIKGIRSIISPFPGENRGIGAGGLLKNSHELQVKKSSSTKWM